VVNILLTIVLIYPHPHPERGGIRSLTIEKDAFIDSDREKPFASNKSILNGSSTLNSDIWGQKLLFCSFKNILELSYYSNYFLKGCHIREQRIFFSIHL
jgi:hypothetical protein